MDPICVYTTRIPAYLLAHALARHGIPSDRFTFHYVYPERPTGADDRMALSDEEILSPTAVFIHAGGMRALGAMGLNPAEAAQQGAVIERAVVLDAQGSILVEYDARELPAELLTVGISTNVFRAALASSLRLDAPRNGCRCGSERDAPRPWQRLPCPGVLLRVLEGELLPRFRNAALMWDKERVFMYVAKFTEATPARLVAGVIPKKPSAKSAERRLCEQEVEGLLQGLRRYIQVAGAVVEDQWFPLEFIGYRGCWDPQRRVLLWGPTTLRLHPFTGQWISHWAIQANRLAERLARSGTVTPDIARGLDSENRTVFWRHVDMMNYYLRPRVFWRAIYRPYAWALRRSSVLRHRVMQRVALT